MPIFILYFIIIPQNLAIKKAIIAKLKKRKGVASMTNEILIKVIGKFCKISTGSLGTNVTGKVIDIKDNWLEVETRKGIEMINADFIQSIKVS